MYGPHGHGWQDLWQLFVAVEAKILKQSVSKIMQSIPKANDGSGTLYLTKIGPLALEMIYEIVDGGRRRSFALPKLT